MAANESSAAGHGGSGARSETDGAGAGPEADRPSERPEAGGSGDRSGDAGGDASGSNGSFSWLILLGLLLFVASLVAFGADLATGHDVVRSLVANAMSAVLLVGWAGLDSYRNPESGVSTVGGAVGTGLILVGLYLLAAGLVVAVTSVLHERLVVGLAMAAGGLPLVLGGFVAYPIDALTAADEQEQVGNEQEQVDAEPGGEEAAKRTHEAKEEGAP